MKKIINYINEGLRINKSNKKQLMQNNICICKPKNRNELIDILVDRLTEDPNADLNDIDVSEITDMSYLFMTLDPHNIDISGWDVSQVETMCSMFNGCKNFNCDLSEWDTSRVRHMRYMFYGCKKFEGKGLENWEVSNVISLNFMFCNCISFNVDLSNWNINKSARGMRMFSGCDSLKTKPSWYREY